MTQIYAVIASFITGALSGFGIGGGTLLMIYMTIFADINQRSAQGINLLYFLPASISALVSHYKNGFIDKITAIPAIISGTFSTLVFSFIATAVDVSILKRIFGVFLILIGLIEIFSKPGSGSLSVPSSNEKPS